MIQRCGDIDVACFDWGRGDPLVLVHGLADDHRTWRKTLARLALDHLVIAYDVRGHGQTSAGEMNGTLEQLSADLVALLDALGIERADLCGFSMGGTIVTRVAIDNPKRVNRLIPVATSSRVGKAFVPWYLERAELALQGVDRLHSVLEDDTRQQLDNALAEFDDQWRIRRQSTANPLGYANACRAMARLGVKPLDPDLPRVQAPTLVISSELDQHCPVRAGASMAASIPGGRLRVIGGCGHQIALEKPAELATEIVEFLAP